MTEKGHIYKIICTLDEKFCYIGSTFNRLSKRFETHRNNYTHWQEGKLKSACACFPYFKEFGIENFKIILIKSYDVCRAHNKDRKHLEAYETLWINKSKCVNKKLPISYLRKEYKQQYYHHFKEHILTRQKEYISKNKEKRKETTSKYYMKNKEKLAESQKKYMDANKEKIKDRRKKYYQASKEKIIKQNYEYKTQRVNCPHCDKEMTKGSLTRHINKYCKNK